MMHFALIMLACVALSACIADTGEEEIPLTESTFDCGTATFAVFDGTRTANADWTDIQATIFDSRGYCTTCHTGAGNGPSNLSLDSDQYDTVVTNQLMSGYPTVSLPIIKPGFKACSFLYIKISTSDSVLNAAGSGSRMPMNHQPLAASDIDLISAWIDEGAIEAAP